MYPSSSAERLDILLKPIEDIFKMIIIIKQLSMHL